VKRDWVLARATLFAELDRMQASSLTSSVRL
jgi:hypothetical protein